MVKYIVKLTSVATPENESFAGETCVYYYGKGGITLGVEGDHAVWSKMPLWEGGIRLHGYDRLCDAKRNWSYKNPENTKYWKSTAEIMEVEC